jgi:glutamate synthase (NADPH/NADH) small chain
MMLRTSSSHEEGCEREWAINTKAFIGDAQGNLKALQIINVAWKDGRMTPIAGSEREIPCERAYIAAGFLHPQQEGLLKELGVTFDNRGNVSDHNYKTSVQKVFTAGDMRRGQSLVVWAISEGRECARAVDAYLTGDSSPLEAKDAALSKRLMSEVALA